LLKVRAVSKKGDKINFNLPLSVAEVLLKNEKIMERAGTDEGGMNLLSKIDFAQIIALVQIGCMGKLMEAESADGDKIEVWVE
ncbi:MAG: XRE family transcriptional regulator, partial [Clostridia bacterium]|nr:XRE family transcriptional regulator [Clostridia bacterium]